jgi:hypothetical protein
MIGVKVWYPHRPDYGLGQIVKVNQYKEYGLPSYQIEHYSVFFKKKGVHITIFKKDLIILTEENAILYTTAR